MGIISAIYEGIKAALRFVRNLVTKIIRALINFVTNVMNWFRGLFLDPKKDVPFIADGNKIKDLLGKAPTRNVGLFKGVYDEETETISYSEYLDADGLDAKTKEVLGNETLVVLS
ncbi:MAG: hypothetical protein HUK15_06215 [Bacteroidales bacterium]|nr:hypothetical protein [Bacteroidales bacterium]